MKSSESILRSGAVCIVFVASLVAAGCGIDKSGSAPITGPSTPSEFALSVTLTATPDQLPRDGASKSTITVLVRDADSRPVSGQRLSVSSTVGSVSQADVVTNADGKTTFVFTAPPFGTVGNVATVRVIPLGGNGSSAVSRSVGILLTGGSNATAPTPDFTSSPVAPIIQEPVVFDASATKDEGVVCGELCVYEWDFGGESTASGRVVTYRFLNAQTYGVKLTVTDGGGASASVSKNVIVATGSEPAASFSFSPTSPGQFEAVQFNGSASRAGAGTGRTLTSYEWKFGDGTTASGVTATHTYTVLGTYQVSLTVTDSAGLKNTATNPVLIVNGVTSSFTSSVRGTLAIFNAEESRGSDSGFGPRNPITTYIWHFGDTTEEETGAKIIEHTFPGAGTYTVTLTVVDSIGRRQTSSKTITIS